VNHLDYRADQPLIVQSDRTILLEVNNPRFEPARDNLARFAELEKSPEHVHTYRLTPLSLWNAAASGIQAEEVIETLSEYGKFAVPDNILTEISEYMARYGRLKLVRENGALVLRADDEYLMMELRHQKSVRSFIIGSLDAASVVVDPAMRGHIKQALIKLGYPVEDVAGYVKGAHLDFELRDETLAISSFVTRPLLASPSVSGLTSRRLSTSSMRVVPRRAAAV